MLLSPQVPMPSLLDISRFRLQVKSPSGQWLKAQRPTFKPDRIYRLDPRYHHSESMAKSLAGDLTSGFHFTPAEPVIATLQAKIREQQAEIIGLRAEVERLQNLKLQTIRFEVDFRSGEPSITIC